MFDTYMRIELPDGTVTPGNIDYRQEPKKLNIDNIDLSNDRVLDIAANDGFWSFWSESRGCKDVLAIDVDDYSKYDWGHFIPDINQINQDHKDKNFYKIREILGSSVKREKLSVYDLSSEKNGMFDLVFCYGLIYHLRHPLLAIDKIYSVCRSTAILRTFTVNYNTLAPISMFYEDDVCNGFTNWNGPNISCVLHWMKNSGFKYFFIEVKYIQKHGMITFCGCKNKDKYYDLLKMSPNYCQIGDDFFINARNKIKDKL
jgi:tRNA (mo5U34)-methyltransferase